METKNILVIRWSAIGDLILTAPITAKLHRQGYTVTLLCKDAYRSVALCLPGVHDVLSWDRDRDRLETSITSYNAIIDLQGTSKSKRWTRRLSGAPVYTYRKPYLRRALLLLTKSKRFSLNPVVERYWESCQSLMQGAELNGEGIELNLPEVSTSFPEQPYIALVIGGSYEGKRLSFEKWRNIIRELRSYGMPIALVGGPEEAGVGESLELPLGSGVYNYCGTTTVLEGLAVIKKAELVVSGDTGFMHAAANFRKPLVSLWGATHPSLGFSPWPKYPKQRAVISKSWWSPLSKHGKRLWFAPNPMKKLSEAEVIASVADLLQDRTKP
jgi:heptosyltransferase-2